MDTFLVLLLVESGNDEDFWHEYISDHCSFLSLPSDGWSSPVSECHWKVEVYHHDLPEVLQVVDLHGKDIPWFCLVVLKVHLVLEVEVHPEVQKMVH